MAPRSSPTARRRRLASTLRDLREERELTLAEIARSLGWSESKVSRIETGRIGIRTDDLDRLLDAYKVQDELRSALQTLRRQASHRGWWASYADALPQWFNSYVGLEDGAKSLTIYDNQLVPGILQTEGYAEAVIKAARPYVTPDEVERQVAARSTRQSLLTRAESLEVWIILDEAVIRRNVGGTDVMRTQLRHLLTLSGLPSVTLQVLPFEHGAHASMGSAFTYLTFPEAGDIGLVYIEDLTSSQYLEEPGDIERYTLVIDHLRASALSPKASTAFIGSVLDALP
ncbi:helix-turn-helix transcriptional regulator [Spirillospora sp. NPDC052269]